MSFDDEYKKEAVTLLTENTAGTSLTTQKKIATEDKQDDLITAVQKLVGFEIPAYDYIALTYVASGNGAGEIETVTYKTGGSGGTVVATLTLAYDANNNIISISKT